MLGIARLEAPTYSQFPLPMDLPWIRFPVGSKSVASVAPFVAGSLQSLLAS